MARGVKRNVGVIPNLWAPGQNSRKAIPAGKSHPSEEGISYRICFLLHAKNENRTNTYVCVEVSVTDKSGSMMLRFQIKEPSLFGSHPRTLSAPLGTKVPS